MTNTYMPVSPRKAAVDFHHACKIEDLGNGHVAVSYAGTEYSIEATPLNVVYALQILRKKLGEEGKLPPELYPEGAMVLPATAANG